MAGHAPVDVGQRDQLARGADQDAGGVVVGAPQAEPSPQPSEAYLAAHEPALLGLGKRAPTPRARRRTEGPGSCRRAR